MLQIHRRDIVEPVEIAERLQIGLVFDQLLVPRCRRPICGSTRSTTSPSSSRTRRNTPCAAGCCGPKLMVKLRLGSSAMMASVPPELRLPCRRYDSSPEELSSKIPQN